MARIDLATGAQVDAAAAVAADAASRVSAVETTVAGIPGTYAPATGSTVYVSKVASNTFRGSQRLESDTPGVHPLTVWADKQDGQGMLERFTIEDTSGGGGCDMNFRNVDLNVGTPDLNSYAAHIKFYCSAGISNDTLRIFKPGSNSELVSKMTTGGTFVSYANGQASGAAFSVSAWGAANQIFAVGAPDGKIQWGAGGTSALDTNLYRDAAGSLRTDGVFKVQTIQAGTGNLTIKDSGASAVFTVRTTDVTVNKTVLLDTGSMLQFKDGIDVELGSTTGTKIGRNATSKLGFFGKAPVVQQSGVTAEAALTSLGLLASPASPAVLDYGAKGDGTTDDATALQAALNSGRPILDGHGRSYKINTSVTIPANVTLQNCRIVLGTAGMMACLVSNGSRLDNVYFYGTGTLGATGVSFYERAVYPAVPGASDVYLDVTVENMTIGVQAQPIAPNTALIPARWTGVVRCKNIVGQIGQSEGYGVLLSPANDCDLKVIADNVARHAAYISAGAARNHIDLTSRDCGFSAFAVASYSDQPACVDNVLTVDATRVRNDPNLGAAAFGIHLINARRNKVRVMLRDSAGAAGAVLLRSSNVNAAGQVAGQGLTRDNDVDVYVQGDVAEYPVISDSGVENRIRVRGVGSTPLNVVVSVRAYNGITAATIPDVYTHDLLIDSIDWDANNSLMYAVRVNPNTKLVDLGGHINMRNSTAASIVSDNTGVPSQIVGVGWREMQNVLSSSIAAGATGTVTMTFQKKYPTKRSIALGASMNGVTGIADAPSYALVSYNSTTNVATVAVKNNTASAGQITVSAEVSGH